MNIFLKKESLGTYLLIPLSAILIVLSFPKFSWSFLAWVAFVPFLKALEGKTARQRFRLGYLTGILCCLGIFYWVTHSMRYFGGLNAITSFSILFLMVFYLALYYRGLCLAVGSVSPEGILFFILGPFSLGRVGIH